MKVMRNKMGVCINMKRERDEELVNNGKKKMEKGLKSKKHIK